MSGPSKPTQSWSNVTSDSQSLSRPVRRHLLNVYLVIAGMLMLTAIGSQLQWTPGGLVEFGVSVGSAVGIGYMRNGNPWRWVLLWTFALFSGMSLTNLISMFFIQDPSGALIFNTLAATVFIFLGFSVSSLLAERRSLLYVGGLASSVLGIMLWYSLANFFFIGSRSMFTAELYMGLLAFIGFVVYDTQVIVEHASAGVLDVPGHALQLFMDLIRIFVRIATILLSKQRDEDRRKRRREGEGGSRNMRYN